MSQPFRRIVTGHNARGESVFVHDGPAPEPITAGPGATRVIELWETRSSPADNRGDDEITNHPFRLPPPKNGTVFRIVEFPPDGERGGAPRDRGRHPGFHKTATTDYAIVLSGEIYALVDAGERLMEPGDVLVQRGTNHAWSNRTGANVYIAFVLVDAEPI